MCLRATNASVSASYFFFFQAEDGIRDIGVTGVQTCALPISEVRTFKGGQPDKTRIYHVYVKPGRRSLVVFRSPAERGQKMLMLGDDFWLVLRSEERRVGKEGRSRCRREH